jgi:membrane protein
VAGGLIAGVAWELAKWAYATFVARSVKYSAIYGSVAAVPIFVLWLYVSWSILLFGARLAFVFQYASSFIHGVHSGSRLGREITGGRTLLAVARAFDGGQPPPDPGELASQLGVPADDVSDVVAALKGGGLVVAVGDGGLVPARPLEKLTLLDVRRALAGEEPLAGGATGAIGAIVQGAEEGAAARLGEVTLRELCDRERAAAPTDRTAAPQPAGRPAEAPARAH